ncbi:MAG: CHAT domain-containing protein [Caldilineaceae bacterium]|nr:CHAT domain-containing protein [Caldilineaceae bacterium]
MRNCHFANFDIAIRGTEPPYWVTATYAAQTAEGTFSESAVAPDWQGMIAQLGDVYARPGQALIMRVGARLFNSLMTPDIYRLWIHAVAREQATGLRLRLMAQPAPVAALPWEALFDPAQNRFVAADGRNPLFRAERLAKYVNTPRSLAATLPIRMLIAAPDDPTESVDFRQQATQLAATLERIGQDRVVVSTLTGRFNVVELAQTIDQQAIDIVHLTTHGEPTGLLLWYDDQATFVPANALRMALNRTTSLKFAFLNACLAGQSSDQTPFTTVGPQLLQTGLPAVMAMQFDIAESDAIAFATFLYQELLAGPCPGAIDAALGYARSNMYALQPERFAFGAPVLWLNSEDGAIFQLGPANPAVDDSAHTPHSDKPAGEISSAGGGADNAGHDNAGHNNAVDQTQELSAQLWSTPTRPDKAALLQRLAELEQTVEQTALVRAPRVLRTDWEFNLRELRDSINQLEYVEPAALAAKLAAIEAFFARAVRLAATLQRPNSA